ncbi:MAG: D-glycero-beta-D-manno-heptose-7-phosphate kinase [Chlorobi bacterium]|nr:D-glycero-beta-D-manno-heptose-7-phosphate kinase [Chlorobiota bacterium]
MEKAKVGEIFNKFEKLRAIVIGDAMVDAYLWGKIERISPEAPIPVVSVTDRENRLGGAANVSLNIQSLGATPILFSIIGNDDKGKVFLDLLEKWNISTEGILIDPGRNTTVKNRVISNGQHIARVDEESTKYISPDLETQLIDSVIKTVGQQEIDVVIFVDYDKGVITPEVIRRITALANEKGIYTAADPKRRNFKLYRDIGLFKPNFKEFKEGVKSDVVKGDLSTLRQIADEYKRKKNFRLIFITLSELGVFISNGVEESYFPANIRYIADVSGAGDTVISVASLCLAAGLPLKILAMMSNIAGGLVCEKVGVMPIDKKQLKKEVAKSIPAI